jgi:hypothetical protein
MVTITRGSMYGPPFAVPTVCGCGRAVTPPCRWRHLLAYHPGRRLLAIYDRGEQRQGAPGEAVVREAKEPLVLKTQPAYSPELDPHERIWKWLRRGSPMTPRLRPSQSTSKRFAIASATWPVSKRRCDTSAPSKPRNL